MSPEQQILESQVIKPIKFALSVIISDNNEVGTVVTATREPSQEEKEVLASALFKFVCDLDPDYATGDEDGSPSPPEKASQVH